jgi:hypothetical protein
MIASAPPQAPFHGLRSHYLLTRSGRLRYSADRLATGAHIRVRSAGGNFRGLECLAEGVVVHDLRLQVYEGSKLRTHKKLALGLPLKEVQNQQRECLDLA